MVVMIYVHAALRPLIQHTYRLRVSVQQRHLAAEAAPSGPVGVKQKGLRGLFIYSGIHSPSHPFTRSFPIN